MKITKKQAKKTKKHVVKKLTKEQHKKRHQLLYRHLDELIADWMRHTQKPVLDQPIIELLKWSAEQMKDPTDPK